MADPTFFYLVTPCCDTRKANYFTSTSSITTGTYTYTGTTYTDPITGLEFINGNCYNIKNEGTGSGVSNLPPATDFDPAPGGCLDEDCPCGLANRYLIFKKCCDGSEIYFKSTESGGILTGIKSYTGPDTYLLTSDTCYRIDVVSVGIGPILNDGMWSTLPLAPNAGNYTNIRPLPSQCDSEGVTPKCLVCPEKCFLLTNCNGDTFYTDTDLTLYVGQFINVSDVNYNPIVGDWYVIDTNQPCQGTYVSSLQVTASDIQVSCDNNCYEVTGTPTNIIYVDQDYVMHEVVGTAKFCSIIPPIVYGGNGTVTNYGLCIDNTCPEICYELTNCADGSQLIVTNSPSVSQHAAENHIITLTAYEGCWSIKITDQSCDCAVNVTVQEYFDKCEDCLPIIAYQFTNCNNPLIIKYSTDDYSVYVGQSVQLDCGECWLVEQIDFIPPATQTININYTFPNCAACNTIYYKLTDCEGIVDPIITSSNLTQVVDKIIKIENCDTCWIISETRDIQDVNIVTVVAEYNTCEDCIVDKPCICSKITNQSNVTKAYTYLDCKAIIQEVIVNAGESSDKACLFNWILTQEDKDLSYIEYFGDCVGAGPYQCPPAPLPKRKVKPGYSTPSCDIEKYEKITCKASEIYYKQVMRLRYGISNCCPEDEEKWLVKKELIDLDALRDPNYICKPTTSCCNQPISSYGCGCNTPLKTCNS